MSLNSSLLMPSVLLKDWSILDQADSQSLSSHIEIQDSQLEQRPPSSIQSKGESKAATGSVVSTLDIPSLDSKFEEQSRGSINSKKQNQSR